MEEAFAHSLWFTFLFKEVSNKTKGERKKKNGNSELNISA